jgi:hypothetical protein
VPSVYETFGYRGLDRVITKVYNDVEHRQRPTSPLILNPTVQAKQSTTDQVFLLNMRPEYLNGIVFCDNPPGGFGPRYDTYWNFSVNPNGMQVSLPTDLPWALKMRLKIKDETVNLGVSLVEYRQTARMFGEFARSVKNTWSRFRGSKISRKRLRPCDVAASELIYSYGVEPLISDLYDSVDALMSIFEKPIYRRFIVTESEEDSFESTSGTTKYRGKWRVSERAITYVELEPDRGSFTLGNPLELAWEVIPFSFVVDWGISIGDYLSSLDALKDVKSVTGTLTRKEWYDHSMDVDDGVHYTERLGKTVINSHERSIISSIPLPAFPSWEPSRSWRAVMHGVSLLTVLNKRCK